MLDVPFLLGSKRKVKGGGKYRLGTIEQEYIFYQGYWIYESPYKSITRLSSCLCLI